MEEDIRKRILSSFEIPAEASGLVDFFFDEKEQQLILQGKEKLFSEEDLTAGELWEEYHRGVLSKADPEGKTYRLNNFYGFLDAFCTSRKEDYDTLSMETRRALDTWYFDAYYARLDTSSGCPTTDRVIPLSDMLQEIDDDPRQIYLNYCDCRSLTGECGHSTRTCLSYRTGINTFTDRGLSEEISHERAKEIILEADKEGLMHTTMGDGICNCCGDCCYLFRAQERMGSFGTWPAARYIAALDPEKCIACGKCEKRCHLKVFRLESSENEGQRRKKLTADFERCAGCGLCVNTCPTGALQLTGRETDRTA